MAYSIEVWPRRGWVRACGRASRSRTWSPRPLSKRGSEPMAVLNNAFGFGGHNVSLVFTAA